MKCTKCNKEWPEATKFCGVCGTKLPEAMAGNMTGDRAKVIEKLREMLPRVGTGTCQEIAPGHFILQRGSTHVDVQVISYNNLPAVRSMAPVTIGSRIDMDLMRFLLLKNAGLPFGAFGLDQRGVVGFSHTILATSMDKEELSASVNTVLVLADEFDDQIVARWGGKTMRQTAIEKVLSPEVLELLLVVRANAAGRREAR